MYKMDTIREFMLKCRSQSPGELKIYEDLVKSLQWNKTRNCNQLGVDVLAFADTHGMLAANCKAFEDFLYEHAKYDVVFALGDITYNDYDILLSYIPYWKVYAVPGNHDLPDLLQKLPVCNLHSECIEIKDGIRIAGIGGSHRYKRGNWPMMTQEESLQLCMDMIENLPPADILIAHDTAFTKAELDIGHTGLVGTTCYINLVNPSYILHGHNHENRTHRYKNGTIEHSVYGMQFIQL